MEFSQGTLGGPVHEAVDFGTEGFATGAPDLALERAVIADVAVLVGAVFAASIAFRVGDHSPLATGAPPRLDLELFPADADRAGQAHFLGGDDVGLGEAGRHGVVDQEVVGLVFLGPEHRSA